MRGTTAAGATGGGRFKETPAPATRVDASFLNMLIDELGNVVTNPAGGNMLLNPGDNGQILKAIQHMIASALPVSFAEGETSVNIAGLILKTGQVRGAYAEGTYWTPFPTPFPAACWLALPIPLVIGGAVNRDFMGELGGETNVNGFYARLNLGGGGTTNSLDGYDWFALGR